MSGFIQDTIGIGTIILAIPLSLSAWQQYRTRSEARQIKLANEAEKLKAAKRAKDQKDLLDAVLKQVQASNGKPTSHIVEDIALQLSTLSTLIACHIGDGHGGHIPEPISPSQSQ